MKIQISILLALTIASSVNSAQWFVIVAGSKGYSNYRHQADSCHAYQIAKAHGVPESNIIHFAYDDIAHNLRNPYPGKIFNKPDGEDVFAGCKIDYDKHHVTPGNYLKVLKGEVTADTPKVLASTDQDDVFLNFADHGAPGLIAFPSKYLYATDLIAAIQTMHQKKMYKKLVYYLEACESGSMFPNLPTDINVYAATAANATESSWGTYCPPDDKVHGKKIHSCLGDLFSVTWMEDVDKNIAGETLGDQFKNILAGVTKSHPMQFGDMSWQDETVASWTGPKSTKVQNFCSLEKRNNSSAVDSRDIKLHYLINWHSQNMTNESMNELNEEIMSRKLFDDMFTNIQSVHENLPIAQDTDFDCYKNLINHFEEKCGKFSDYGMKYMRSFYDICFYATSGEGESIDMISDAKALVNEACSEGQLF